jgi:hypothetical protein
MPTPTPSSGTTGVAHELRSSRPNSTHEFSARMIGTLERREGPHIVEIATSFIIFYLSDGPCLSLYDLCYVAIADGEGWTRRSSA